MVSSRQPLTPRDHACAPFDREHADPLAAGLPPLALDRQRVVHSSAFRRLQYKTQVFVAASEDHYRTRLTHTLEVAQLARVIAAALGLDEALAEVVALAHDLGHPPFGHAGERALNECLADAGGFEHNSHALRVVEHLEHPYPAFRGLNLTRVVRECMAKHSTRYDRPGAHPLHDGRPPPPEGQAAAIADRLAYALHDVQDGLYAGLIDPAAVGALELWQCAADAATPEPRCTREEPRTREWRRELRSMVDRIRSILVEDVVRASRAVVATAGATSASAVVPLIRLSGEMERRVDALDALLRSSVYRDHRLVRMDAKARRIVLDVFRAYVEEPRLMPPRFARRVGDQPAARVAADYLAGMTDRFCLREHARLFDPRMDV